MRTIPLAGLITFLATTFSGGDPALGQESEADAEIIAAGAAHLRAVSSPVTAAVGARIGFEVAELRGNARNGPDNMARAERVAALVAVQPGTRSQFQNCERDRPDFCRLTVDAVFQFGRPVILGDTARVLADVRIQSPPNDRSPFHGGVTELTVVRVNGRWTVTKSEEAVYY